MVKKEIKKPSRHMGQTLDELFSDFILKVSTLSKVYP